MPMIFKLVPFFHCRCLMKQLGYQVESINFSTDEFSTSASRDSSIASPTTSKKMKPSEDVRFDAKLRYLEISHACTFLFAGMRR